MKICIQTGGITDYIGFEEGYKAIAAAGFEAIDWNIDHSLSYSDICAGKCEGNCIFEKELDEILAHYEDELACIRKNGLEISQAHAPFPCYVPGKPFVLDYMIEIYKKMILFCDKVGCKNLVVHGYSMTRTEKNTSLDNMDMINDKLYTSLIPTLKETNVTVCLENLFAGGGSGLVSGVCADPREAAEMIDAYNNIAGKECFGLCLDTGHMNLVKHDPRRYIPIVGSRIKALHLHDNMGAVDEHKAPYTGNIDWKNVYTMLKEVGYRGDLSFETFHQVNPDEVERELMEPWLNLICSIGKHFRNKILGE